MPAATVSPVMIQERYQLRDCRSFIRQHPLANVITTGPDTIYATSTPVIFESDALGDGQMICHMARRNPHAGAILPNQRCLAIFSGPNAYVSASWYKDKPEVPTWNYVSVQVRGVLMPLDDLDANRAVLERTAAFLEMDQSEPWKLDGALGPRVDALLPHIRSFRFNVDRIDGIERLGQSHPPEDRLRVICQLVRRGSSEDLHVARLMAEHIE